MPVARHAHAHAHCFFLLTMVILLPPIVPVVRAQNGTVGNTNSLHNNTVVSNDDIPVQELGAIAFAALFGAVATFFVCVRLTLWCIRRRRGTQTSSPQAKYRRGDVPGAADGDLLDGIPLETTVAASGSMDSDKASSHITVIDMRVGADGNLSDDQGAPLETTAVDLNAGMIRYIVPRGVQRVEVEPDLLRGAGKGLEAETLHGDDETASGSSESSSRTMPWISNPPERDNPCSPKGISTGLLKTSLCSPLQHVVEHGYEQKCVQI